MSAALDPKRFWGLSGAGAWPERLTLAAGESCQGRVAELELHDELRPPWLLAGERVPLWLDQEPASGDVAGRALAHVVVGGERRPGIVQQERGIVFRFDPEAAVASIVEERYFTPQRPLHTRFPVPYQVVPGPIRLWLFGVLARAERLEAAAGFPAWPLDRSVDSLRWAFRQAWALAGGVAPAPTAWPEAKRYAFTLSHDVDTRLGLRLVPEVAAFEGRLGFRSCWFVVGDLAGVDPPLLDSLREQGHEIGLHGDRHDNRIGYLERDGVERRLRSCAEMVERHGIRGWRSPSLLSSPTLRDALNGAGFRYTSEVPDSEVGSLIAPRRGCATCFPFVRQGLVEVPITLPFEDKLLLLGMDENAILETWRKKLSWAKQVGGVAQLAIHNEPHLLGRCRGAYERLLGEVMGDQTAWRATLGEIADWWRRDDA